ncbi:hypothetical protein [Prochlorococcus marinus]|uniref:hypothetical protein n=1 Tax=Prochlorococcus marinus TaxID=1219 RepID=UPI001CED67E2|nr:hypothetical protein [Prochlorococcus marinus]
MSSFIRLKSLDGCRLTIGSFPPFLYDSRGGGGIARITFLGDKRLVSLKFDPYEFSIPSLNWRTSKFLGLPIPPGLEINMVLDKLEGTIDRDSGEVLLDFEARFILKIFNFWEFPKLIVSTSLSTGHVVSNLHDIKGQPLNNEEISRLVGVAVIPPTGNMFLDRFLGLPNEAMASLECEIKEGEVL